MNFIPTSRIAASAAAALVLSLCPLMAAAASVSITTPPNQTTILPGMSVALTITATGFSSPTYRIMDSFSSGSISNSNITNTGEFSWTPKANDLGTHSLTITVSDQYASQSVHITFDVVSSLPLGAIMFGPPSPSANLVAGQTLTFWTIVSGFPETPSKTLTDSLPDSSISITNINETNQLTWTTTARDVGTHVITLTAKDRKGNSASKSITVVVNPAPHAPDATSTPPTTTQSGQSSPQTPSVPAAPTFTHYLKPGSENAQVLALQKLLKSLGFLSATPNGYYGVGTTKAVLAFQAAHHLTKLGVVGPATRAALNAIVASSTSHVSSAQTGSQAAPTQSLQQRLQQLQAQLAGLTGH